MKRKASEDILKWYHMPNRQPLIIKGARQVGKTWIMKDFVAQQSLPFVYINFEDEKTLQDLFIQDFDLQRILERISLQKNVEITPDTVLLFDEIQEAPHGITVLKYFAEKLPQQPVVAAGSLLGIAMHSNDSFPVGKVDFMEVLPMDFEEYLWAAGESGLSMAIKEKKWPLITSLKEKLTRLLRTYYYIGGMPKVVANFMKDGDFSAARRIQEALLASYENDFSKHAPASLVPRLRLVWHSLVSQLARENKKFLYGLVKTGARAREYEMALEWLEDAGVIYRVYRTKSGEFPLKAYLDPGAFKVFLMDIGLLGAMCGITPQTVVDRSDLLGSFKGALAEQYVLQQLRPMKDTLIYYWSAEASDGEIDFLLQQAGKVVPIEVKAEENLRAKSLRVFSQKYAIAMALRFSMADYREQDWMTNIPLYGVQGAFSRE
ncbi:MAG: ATP-binding protein [Bacteroidales bacterium]|nr:ATP-binding protein [Bacteroidales bacterium]